MGALVWVMIGLAIWHFTIFLPDKFLGGIVGAFLGATIGGFVFGLLINGLSIPGKNDTDMLTAIESIPGVLAGIGLVYFLGARDERLTLESRGGLGAG